MGRLFLIRFPRLLSNLFCCRWNHGSFPSMNSFSPCNQLWLVLFNINLSYFFKERYQSVAAHPCLLKAAPLLLAYHSLNQKGRRKQLGFTFLFFSFKVHKCQLPQGCLAQRSSVIERTKSAWSKGCRRPTAKMEGGKETTGLPEVWMSAQATVTCVFTLETCWDHKGV